MMRVDTCCAGESQNGVASPSKAGQRNVLLALTKERRVDLTIDIVLYIVLVAFAGAGVVLTLFQLPGTWVIAVASGAYAWYYHGERLSLLTILVIFAIATTAEVVETGTGAVFGRRAGASRRAAIYGMIGGILGALLLTIPVPIIGTIIGAAIGCFAGACVAEMQQGRTFNEGARSGWYSALGRTVGSILKLMAAIMMACIVIVLAGFSFWR